MGYLDQLEELERLRKDWTGRLETLDSEAFNRQPSAGAWSAAQVTAHVINAERRSLAYLRKKLQQPEAVPRSGLVSATKSVLLGLVMRSRFKVSAPPGAGEVPDHAEFDQLAGDWQEVRDDWRSFIEEFPAELAGRAVYKHPVAGRLNLEQALGFLVQHLRRHAGQVDRVLSAHE